MSGDDKKMTDMTPIKRKRSLLERADSRFDFGGQLRRVEPGSLEDGPVVEAKPVRRKPDPAARKKPARVIDTPVEDVAPSSDIPAADAVELATPAPVPAPTPAPAASSPTPAIRQTSTPAVARRRFTPSAPVQAIDRAGLAAHGFIDPEGNVGALAEEFRIIKRQILRTAPSQPHGRRVLLTSAQPDEGKTFSVINLALSLAAEQECSVILIDTDFARNDVASRLGLVAGPGLMDALADPSIDIARCVIPTDVPRLAVLPAGQSVQRDAEMLNSARMAAILDQLDADAPDRILLFDSMPLLAASSTGVVAAACGQVVVVVRADVTREAVLKDAISLIGQHGGISLLLNRVRFTPEGRRFGSYYGEGG